MPLSSHDTDPDSDRRRHARRAAHTPLVLKHLRRWTRIPCEAIDLSIGGMRVRADKPIPVGGCELIVLPDTEHTLVLLGEVLEAAEDADGTWTARICFHPVLSPAAAPR
jgi:hypothetical protein